MAPKVVTQGETGYDEIHAAWVLNFRPSEFDLAGNWGGALIQVIDTGATYPDFYWVASERGTLVNNDSLAPEIEKEGWHTVNKRGGRQQFRWVRSRTDIIRTRILPLPNDLEPSAAAES